MHRTNVVVLGHTVHTRHIKQELQRIDLKHFFDGSGTRLTGRPRRRWIDEVKKRTGLSIPECI